MMSSKVLSVEEYERRILARILREVGVDPQPVVERFVKLRDRYAAHLIERLALMEPDEASRTAEKLLRSQNPFDKTLGAWLASRGSKASEPLLSIYV